MIAHYLPFDLDCLIIYAITSGAGVVALYWRRIKSLLRK